ncbi:hypothetical protein AAT19DRAFT_9965 [Rhodotorula toruloides]|uniref:Uncharacterized protein n=1 Tax=Rhodotorula toruloides TaxID=5286 RepID=A0A2T0A1H3_RHOTO|nr:hypothetical protein AAT19DRAFT_9965 [Rhodotorula toruloides]
MSATNVHGRRPTTLDPLSPTHPPSLLPAEGRFSPAPPTSPASPASTPITLERGNDVRRTFRSATKAPKLTCRPPSQSPVLPLPRDPPSSASSPLVPWESTNCDKDVTDDEKEPLAPTGVKEFSAADWEEPTKPRTSWWRIWVKATVVTLLLVALIAGIAVGITEASKSVGSSANDSSSSSSLASSSSSSASSSSTSAASSTTSATSSTSSSESSGTSSATTSSSSSLASSNSDSATTTSPASSTSSASSASSTSSASA